MGDSRSENGEDSSGIALSMIVECIVILRSKAEGSFFQLPFYGDFWYNNIKDVNDGRTRQRSWK